MPHLGRWMAIDPLAEKHPDWTPYNYVLANPLNLYDPDGRQERATTGRYTGPLYYESGGTMYMSLDERALLNGTISVTEFRNRQVARGIGGFIGVGLVGGGFMLPEIVAWGQSFLVPFTTLMVKYGDKVLPVAEGILCGEACGFGNGSRISDEVAEQIGNVNSYWRAFGTGGTQNCVSCSIATDAVLSGRPASALSSLRGVSDDFYESVFGDVNWIRGVKPQDFMKYLPNSGDRGIVNAFNGMSGHAFNVINDNGVIRFIAGQNNIITTNINDIMPRYVSLNFFATN